MNSFGPVVNSFKKKTKPSRAGRAHGREPLSEDAPLLTKKQPGGLRSPKGGSVRSPGAKSRASRAPPPGCEAPAARAPQAVASRSDVQSPAAGQPPRATKKRTRSSSRPAESAGSCAASEGRQSAASADDTVKVVVRIRPPTAIDERTGLPASCVRQLSEESLAVVGTPERTQFSYDYVAGPEVGQEQLFGVAGCPVVENCLAGYNSCVFAYGQTGSGKTHTMLGDLPGEVGPSWLPTTAGLMPRIFQYLFTQIAERQAANPAVQYTCTCSLLEIYNEMITDLLNPAGGSTNLQLREDITTGVYVEGLSVETVRSAQHAMDMLRRGSENRRVGETCMNTESSRSHCVLTCVIESKVTDGNGFTNVLSSRLNLVDLAGSERQKTSGAAGGRLREASSINRSLSTLGLVIMSLMEVQQRGRRTKHVPYRDSKLTFLLQDSLGGNSKTVMIANVSPSPDNMTETISTLRFARRAKFIKNRAVVNEDLTADANLLKQEIAMLNAEVAKYRAICQQMLGTADPTTSGRRHHHAGSIADSGPPSSRSDRTPRSARSERTPRSARSSARSSKSSRSTRSASRAMDPDELRSRAEAAASKVVSAASLEIEQAMAKAEKARRKAEQELKSRAEQDSSSIRDLQAQLGARLAEVREDREKLQMTVDYNQRLLGDNQRLQNELLAAGSIVAGLSREKEMLEGQVSAKMQVEAEAEEACMEAAWAKDRLSAVAHEKKAAEAQLRLAVEDNKNLHLRNKQLEELVAEREQRLLEVGAGGGARHDGDCKGAEGEEACSCGMEIVRLEGQYHEEKEKTYRLMRELEILTLQQDEEFRDEFGSCKDQLVTLLKKLEDATNELNHLKHTLVERDSEVQDLQEFVETTSMRLTEFAMNRGLLEDQLREQLMEKDELVNKVRALESELDGARRTAREGLQGGDLMLVESLQAELENLRQENSRLSCRMEGKNGEVASLRAELAAMRACSGCQSPLVSEVKPAGWEGALQAQDLGFQALGGRTPLSPLSPQGWGADADLQRTIEQARSLVAQAAEAGFPDEMEVDLMDGETLQACAPGGKGLVPQRNEVACL
eukprot:evm.model.scf_213EXC.2 EVM.evm.TU.scf_213EXC.2   scf_213EXC:40552-44200(-)